MDPLESACLTYLPSSMRPGPQWPLLHIRVSLKSQNLYQRMWMFLHCHHPSSNISLWQTLAPWWAQKRLKAASFSLCSWIWNYYFFKIFLFERQTYIEKERQRVTSQRVTMASDVLAQSWEPGAPSLPLFHTGIGSQGFEPSSTTLPGHKNKAWLEVKQLRHELATIWDATTQGGGVTRWAMVQPPKNYLTNTKSQGYNIQVFRLK